MTRAALLLVVAAVVQAQPADPSKKPEFEVVSIRPAKPDGSHDFDVDGSICRVHNFTLKRLSSFAFMLDTAQVYGGPNWVDDDSYDITAKIPDASMHHMTRQTVPELIQTLLADKFGLVYHLETRQATGYEMVVARKGPKMEPAQPDQKGSNISSHDLRLTARNVTMEHFAKYLSRQMGMPVIDKTELTGGFNFELENFYIDRAPERADARPDSNADTRPSIFTLLPERLGIKLESAKIPTPAMVIEQAKKPELN